MTDSITPWINSAALAHISTYDTLMPDTSTSYEHGGHVQLLKITSDPYCPHGVWCEFSDREVIVNAFVPREEIDAFNLSSAEKFLEQQYGVFTIKRYRWHAWQPAFAKRRVGNEETEYEKRARRVCMLVIDMELLAPSLGGPVSDAGGKHPKELARSREADVRSWNERCVERWFEDLTIEVNAGRRRRKEEELTMEEVRKEEDDLRVPPVVVAHEVEDVKPVITRGEVVRAPSVPRATRLANRFDLKSEAKRDDGTRSALGSGTMVAPASFVFQSPPRKRTRQEEKEEEEDGRREVKWKEKEEKKVGGMPVMRYDLGDDDDEEEEEDEIVKDSEEDDEMPDADDQSSPQDAQRPPSSSNRRRHFVPPPAPVADLSDSDDSDNAGEEVFHHLTGTHSSGPEPEPEPDNNNNNFLFNFSNEDDEEELLPTQLDEPTQLPSPTSMAAYSASRKPPNSSSIIMADDFLPQTQASSRVHHQPFHTSPPPSSSPLARRSQPIIPSLPIPLPRISLPNPSPPRPLPSPALQPAPTEATSARRKALRKKPKFEQWLIERKKSGEPARDLRKEKREREAAAAAAVSVAASGGGMRT